MRSPVLAPFRIRNYRFQWPADLLTSWAFEMETLILGWYILVETGSVLLLTLFAALQFLGTLISPMFGVAGDRIGHGLLLCVMRTVYVALSATLAVIIFYGAVTPLIVLVVAGALGCVRPSDLAVRSSLIAETMPPQDLMGAMSLSRTTQDTARIVGALAGAALFAALGLTIAYAIVATLYALGLALTICVVTMARAERPKPDAGTAAVTTVRPTLWRDLHEGMAYVWTTPQLLAAMWLAFLVNLTAYPFTNGLLPYVAREVYRIDQTGLGYLIASFAVGAIIASIGMSFAASRLWPARMMIVFAGRLVRAAADVRPGGERTGRDSLAGAGRLCAGHEPGAAAGDAAAQFQRSAARPRHGRAHARHLRPAGRAAGRRRADRAYRLQQYGDALCRYRACLRAADRGALARRPVARSGAG